MNEKFHPLLSMLHSAMVMPDHTSGIVVLTVARNACDTRLQRRHARCSGLSRTSHSGPPVAAAVWTGQSRPGSIGKPRSAAGKARATAGPQADRPRAPRGPKCQGPQIELICHPPCFAYRVGACGNLSCGSNRFLCPMSGLFCRAPKESEGPVVGSCVRCRIARHGRNFRGPEGGSRYRRGLL
jgi:hypothetical protein